MPDMMSQFLPGNVSSASDSRFPTTSRYYGLDTGTLQKEDGTTVPYVLRRFIPQPDQYALLEEHIVTDGERPDTVAADYTDDPEQFWRICDANNVMDPNELTDTTGRSIRITLPAGIPGASSNYA